MQRVVRSTLVGLLTVAGLSACGDKITIPPATTTPLDPTVRSVTVSPSVVANLAVGSSVTLAASVDAGAGVTDRTVTWSSSDATVASVDAQGKVTGVKVGVATITAASKAAADVKGASVVTVVAAGGGTPQVIVTGITKNGTNQPVNISGVEGQIDVLLDVQTNGAALRTVSATLNCPGNTTMTQTQTIAEAAGSDASESQIPVILSFPTDAFTVANGVGTPRLRNGSCSLVASATTGAAGSPQTATTTTQLTLANENSVTFNNTFTAVPNAEGITPTTTQANDQFGLPWRAGSVTVQAIPVMYGNVDGTAQQVASVSITLNDNMPADNVPTVTLTAAPYSQTWTASLAATSGPRVTGLVLTGAGIEQNGQTPKTFSPKVVAVDGAGNSIDLKEVGGGTNVSFRLDNQAPQAPLIFNIPGRQQGWINAAYTFTGAGTGTDNDNTESTANFASCGDGVGGTLNPYHCSAQTGVSFTGNGATVSTNASTNPNMTYSFYVIPAASYTSSISASTANGTSTSATACSTTGWTKVANGGEVASASSPNNVSFVVRMFETDKLGNARCTDLAKPTTDVADVITSFFNTGVANSFFNINRGTFGVDVVAPTAAFAAGSATDMQIVGIGGTVPNWTVALSDDASGFSTSPIATQLRRLAASGTACAVGTGSGCTAKDTAATFIANANKGIGYYTYTGTARDLARNAAPALTRQIVVDNVAAPTMGSIATPVTINGGSSVTFSTSAADDLDLIEWDNTLAYAVSPNGVGAQPLSIRSARTSIHPRFSGTLITSQPLSIVVPTFIRTMSVTGAGGAVPVGTAGAVLPASIAARAYDAGGNASTPNAGTGAGFSNIPAASINTTTNALTDWSAAPAGQNASAVMSSFAVTNTAANISNCPTAGCAGNVAPTNATSVTLTAAATGATGLNYQFANPFSQVQFYYLDATSNEYIMIGSTSVPVVTDPAAGTRVFTFSLSWDPPAAIGVGAVTIVAVGVNSRGDALATPINTNITLTNP